MEPYAEPYQVLLGSLPKRNSHLQPYCHKLFSGTYIWPHVGDHIRNLNSGPRRDPHNRNQGLCWNLLEPYRKLRTPIRTLSGPIGNPIENPGGNERVTNPNNNPIGNLSRTFSGTLSGTHVGNRIGNPIGNFVAHVPATGPTGTLLFGTLLEILGTLLESLLGTLLEPSSGGRLHRPAHYG